MTWSAILVDVVQGERWSYRIVYTDGQQKVDRTYQSEMLDDAAIQATARAEIASLSAVAGSVGKVSIQIGAQIDLAPPADPAPASDPMAAFNVASSRLRQLRLYADGVSSPSLDQAIADAVKAKQAALDSYVGPI